MFNQLFNLFNSNTRKKPLEDFTTEIFAGVLRSHSDILVRFCKEILKMQGDEFWVDTQVYYPTLDAETMNCFVDMGIESSEEICFIENKVHSSEGFEQLERYASVLDTFEEKSTYLKYCTKHHDPKTEISRQYGVKHHFSQFQWHEVGKFLSSYKDKPLVNHFINYLEQHNMYTDMTLKPADLFSMENLQRTHMWLNAALDKTKPAFNQHFGGIIDPRGVKEFHEQVRDQNRFCIYAKEPITGAGWSEILYAIDLAGSAVVQIYLEQKHPAFKAFMNLAEKGMDELKAEQLEGGGRLVAQLNLAKLINDEMAEQKLHEWFLKQFDSVSKFILSTKDELNWKEELVERATNLASPSTQS